MPTGPVNRVADNGLARQRLRWAPAVSFVEGLHHTIDWYFSSKNRDRVSAELSAKLLER
jgi:nucleoside-diphosphate-sugar epimerase